MNANALGYSALVLALGILKNLEARGVLSVAEVLDQVLSAVEGTSPDQDALPPGALAAARKLLEGLYPRG